VSAALIDVRNLVVRFRARRGLDAALSRGPAFVTAVDDVSLAIERGEILGLVGESGSGKTTLGKAILRLVEPRAGRILFAGRDLLGLPERELRCLRRKMQTVFQDPLSSLNPRHRVAGALATPLRLHRVVAPEVVGAKVDETLRRVGLSPVFRDRYPHELSGGQLQRVAVARALTLDPEFLVADEAVSKLDVSVRAQILNLFKDIQAATGLAMLFITHDLHVARYLCDRIGVMYFGKLVELAPTERLFANPRHPYTRALLATVAEEPQAEADRLLAQEALNPSEDDRIGCRFYKRCPLRVARCAERHPPFEPVAAGHEVACYEWRKAERGTPHPMAGSAPPGALSQARGRPS